MYRGMNGSRHKTTTVLRLVPVSPRAPRLRGQSIARHTDTVGVSMSII
jgi:hypothetical protein